MHPFSPFVLATSLIATLGHVVHIAGASRHHAGSGAVAGGVHFHQPRQHQQPIALADLASPGPLSTSDSNDTLSSDSELPDLPRRVAIIGAGASGTSAAYHLQKYVDQCSSLPKINITIFERRPYVGGRSITTDAFGNPDYPVEMGGSVFIKKNPTLVDAAIELNLPLIELPDRPAPKPVPVDGGKSGDVKSTSFWNGNKVTFQFSRRIDIILRWGVMTPFAVTRLTTGVVKKFLNIYTSRHFPFFDIKTAFDNLGLGDMFSKTGKEWLQESNLWSDFAFEWVQFL